MGGWRVDFENMGPKWEFMKKEASRRGGLILKMKGLNGSLEGDENSIRGQPPSLLPLLFGGELREHHLEARHRHQLRLSQFPDLARESCSCLLLW